MNKERGNKERGGGRGGRSEHHRTQPKKSGWEAGSHPHPVSKVRVLAVLVMPPPTSPVHSARTHLHDAEARYRPGAH